MTNKWGIQIHNGDTDVNNLYILRFNYITQHKIRLISVGHHSKKTGEKNSKYQVLLRTSEG